MIGIQYFCMLYSIWCSHIYTASDTCTTVITAITILKTLNNFSQLHTCLWVTIYTCCMCFKLRNRIGIWAWWLPLWASLLWVLVPPGDCYHRIPIAFLQSQVPYTVLFNKSPNYNFLRNFGCSCYSFLRPCNKHKLDFRSHECLLLGYSISHKDYKCLYPNDKLYVSKDVIFNELKYPYNDLFPPLSNFVTSSKSDFLPNAHIPLVSPSPNELTHSSQHAETNSISVSIDPSRSLLNTEFPNSQNVTSSSPLSNVEPNSVTNEN